MLKRVIWDFDGTITDGDFSKEISFFEEKFGKEEAIEFNKIRWDLIGEYEKKYPRYDIKTFSDFFSKNSGNVISEKIVNEWMDYIINVNEKIHPGAITLLDYFNSLGVENVIYTNWFLKTQVGRVKKLGLTSYFKEIVSGEEYMKPSIEGTFRLCGTHQVDECLMIGDNYEKDIIPAKTLGINAVYYCPSGNSHKEHVKELIKVKEMF